MADWEGLRFSGPVPGSVLHDSYVATRKVGSDKTMRHFANLATGWAATSRFYCERQGR